MDSDLLAQAQQLFDLLPLPDGTVRHLFLKKSAGKVLGTWINKPESLLRLLALYTGRFDMYWQLNPSDRKDLPRPSSRDVTHLQCVLVDIDPVSENAEPSKAAAQVTEILTTEFSVPQECMSVLDSGRGIQLWLHMPPIQMASHRIIEHDGKQVPTMALPRYVAAFIRNLANRVETVHGCRIDTACSDPARLARLPGSINLKTGNMAMLHHAGTPQQPDWLFAVEPVEELPPTEPAEPRDQWPQIVPHLTHTAFEFITEGMFEPGRHKAAVATIRNLHRDVNVPSEKARDLLLLGASRCTPQVPYHDVMRIWRDEYGGSV